ncbi:hypothetical protein TL16_g12950 [Triparma laevis f. inornata]|uniref:Polycystin cation channel PKD1/PKD2 domain-containing protein n=1 Tax=Triparma laevis f. inornata TaxID=1714386 RepID=A0A9W7EY23_9STRA|nr:hypothetical protein TL16_g12950 [Triparma laevis f. inornata]
MNNGSIAAAVSHKRRNSSSSSNSDSSLELLDLDNPIPTSNKTYVDVVIPVEKGIIGNEVFQERPSVLGYTPGASSVSKLTPSLQPIPITLRPQHSKHMKKKKIQVLEAIKDATDITTHRKGEYADLCGFLVYMFLFLVIVILQQRAADVYAIGSTHVDFLFSEESGTVSWNDGRVLTKVQDLNTLTSWLENTIVDGVFIDPVCGDGLCEQPQEFASVFEGRAGCSADCGTFLNTTKTYVEFHVDEQAYTDITSTGVEDVSWNICWTSVGVCYYANPKQLFTQEQLDAAIEAQNAAASVTATVANVTGVSSNNTNSTSSSTATSPTYDTYKFELDLVDGEWELEFSTVLIPGRIYTIENKVVYTPVVNSTNFTTTTTSRIQFLSNWSRCGSEWDQDLYPFTPRPSVLSTDVNSEGDQCPFGYNPDEGGGDYCDGVEEKCPCDQYDAILNGADCCWDECNVEGCYWGLGFCENTVEMWLECAPGCPAFLLGDDTCHEWCNNAACQMDRGDCCVPAELVQPFQLYRYGSEYAEVLPDTSIPLQRFVGRRNRLIAGILVTQNRMKNGVCVGERSTLLPPEWNAKRFFDSEIVKRFLGRGDQSTTTNSNSASSSGGFKYGSIYDSCITGELSAENYGVDPVFLPAAALYDRKLKAAEIYDTKKDANEINSGGLPYGFHYFDAGSSLFDGFQAFFDINFSNARAKAVFQYLIQGFYFDMQTKDVQINFVTVNGHTSSFTLNTINFEFEESGTISMKHSINSFSSEVYATSDDFVRMCMELLFIVLSLVNLGTELSEIVVAKIETGHFRTYFKSFWNYVDLANLLLFFYSAWFWVQFVRALGVYAPRERWEVLESLDSEGNFLSLDEDESLEMIGFLEDTANLVLIRSRQNFINGVALLLLIMRLLKNLDFQPRLGLVTRTLSNAVVNLSHFILVFGLIFFSYSVMGHLAFGGELEKARRGFHTLMLSMHTCFSILFGDIDLTNDFVNSDNVQIGFVFFYSYMAIVFFVLLNILLAILVDAYMDVKTQAEDSKTMISEICDVLSNGVSLLDFRGKRGKYRTSEIHQFAVRLLLMIEKEKEAATTSRIMPQSSKKYMVKDRDESKQFFEEGAKVGKFKVTKKVHAGKAQLVELIKEQIGTLRKPGAKANVDAKSAKYLDDAVIDEMAVSILRIYGKEKDADEEDINDAELVLAETQEMFVQATMAQKKAMNDVKMQIGSEIKEMNRNKFKMAINKEKLKLKLKTPVKPGEGEGDKMASLFSMMSSMAKENKKTQEVLAGGVGGGWGGIAKSLNTDLKKEGEPIEEKVVVNKFLMNSLGKKKPGLGLGGVKKSAWGVAGAKIAPTANASSGSEGGGSGGGRGRRRGERETSTNDTESSEEESETESDDEDGNGSSGSEEEE